MKPFLNYFWDVVGKFWPPLVAIIITQWINWLRIPKLKIDIDSPEGLEVKYNDGGQIYNIRSYRFKVQNKKLPFVLNFIPREVAKNCNAKFEFINSKRESLFIMRGRWVNSPEVPHMAEGSQFERTLFPDPIDILSGKDKEEILDCLVRFNGETEAYGWNNEAYFNHGKTPRYKLKPEEYRIKIHVVPQNGKPLKKEFGLIIEPDKIRFLNQIGSEKMESSLKLFFVGFCLYFFPRPYRYLARKWFDAKEKPEFWEERSIILRKRFWHAFQMIVISLGVLIFILYLNGVFKNSLGLWFRVLASIFLLTATLGRAGWDIQSLSGGTYLERIDRGMFIISQLGGTGLLILGFCF